ncbi:MAG: sporulation protein YqfD [Acutalibacteraceae bacterium]|nr:sporulation protein YqfD [Acutalibacteraceae bacterium]
MLVKFLRWLFGYIRFTIEGNFPERFLNAAARRGVDLWKLSHENGHMTAQTRQREYAALCDIACKTDTQLTDIHYGGLPAFLKRYRRRKGLLIGLVLCGIGCHYLSGIVWSINVRTPSLINEYEVRQLLREHGLTEGTPAKNVNVSDIINSISVNDRRVSWMTVNIMDTNAEINISPNLASFIGTQTPVPLSNMKSIADGTVTKVEVYQGTAHIRVGDGIRKDQLLVSGLVEYNNGHVELTDCEAHVFARTHRAVTIRLPKQYTIPQRQQTTLKRAMTAFGLSVPLTVTANPSEGTVCQSQREQLTLLGHPLPIYITEENWHQYEEVPVELTLPQAQTLLQHKLSLYEFFMLSSTQQGTIVDRKITCREEADGFILQADYTIEEDVCRKSVIPLSVEEPAENSPVT